MLEPIHLKKIDPLTVYELSFDNSDQIFNIYHMGAQHPLYGVRSPYKQVAQHSTFFCCRRETESWLFFLGPRMGSQMEESWFHPIISFCWTGSGWGDGSFRLYLPADKVDELLDRSSVPDPNSRLVKLLLPMLANRPT